MTLLTIKGEKVAMKKDKGLLIVLSGPSGVGKGTVCKALRNRDTDIVYSVSATTRSPRVGEVEGINYFFKSKTEFEQMIEEEQLLEWAQYVSNYYGTPRAYVEEQINLGNDVILEIEVQGALKVKDKFPHGVFIFLSPPSMEELRHRIITRGTETDASVKNRMSVAKEEIDMMEYYDYVVVNDQVEWACDRIEAIIIAEHCKKERKIKQYRKSLQEAK
jgi:guanylate kinase